MKVRVRYLAQLRLSAGRSVDEIELSEKATVRMLLTTLCDRQNALRNVLFNEGRLQPTILLFLGEQQVHADHPLCEGDELTLLTPIAGGL